MTLTTVTSGGSTLAAAWNPSSCTWTLSCSADTQNAQGELRRSSGKLLKGVIELSLLERERESICPQLLNEIALKRILHDSEAESLVSNLIM